MTLLTPERIRTISQPEKFATSMHLFNTERLASLAEMIANGQLDARMSQKWNDILAIDNTYVLRGPIDPFNIPPYYDDPDANMALTTIMRDDGITAVDLGLRYRMLGDEADAAAVAGIIEPWTTIQTFVNLSESRLTWSYKWTLFMQAAQLIEGSAAYTPALKSTMETFTRAHMDMSTAYVQTENRAMWGCVLEVSAGAFLNDRAMFDKGIARWRELFESDVKGNIPVREILRGEQGLHYCNFMLNALAQTAEIARFNGEWLYDFVASDGSTLKGVWETVAGWTARPETYPYWPGSGTIRIQAHVDILHALWPNQDSQALIETYTTTQDTFGYRQGILAYRKRPLWG